MSLAFKISRPNMSGHQQVIERLKGHSHYWKPSRLVGPPWFYLRKFLLGGGYTALLGAPWPISHDLGFVDMQNTIKDCNFN